MVRLDVSVLDKDRRPVRNLTAADFTVLEEGEPRPIVAFSAVDVPNTPDRLDTRRIFKSRLAAGDYLLTIEVRAGNNAARRVVRFTVK